MSIDGPPFPRNIDEDGPKGKPPEEKFDLNEALNEATLGVPDSVETPHETHIPVEQVTDGASKLKEVPSAFAELGSLRHLFKSGSSEDVTAQSAQDTSKQEKELTQPTTALEAPNEKKVETSPQKRPVDGMRRVPKQDAPRRQGGGGYAKEQKEIGRAVGEALDIGIQEAALRRLKELPNWDKYRFTGELTEKGFLVEKPDERGAVREPHVLPSEIVYTLEGKSGDDETMEQDVVKSVSTPIQTESLDAQDINPSVEVNETTSPATTDVETPDTATEEGVKDVPVHVHTGTPTTPEVAGVDTDIDNAEGEIPQPSQKEAEAEEVKPITQAEVSENIEPVTAPAPEENLTLEPEKKELTLEEDGVVYLSDKDKPETWKVLEENQVTEADPNDPSTWSVVPTERKPFRDISDPDFVADSAPTEKQKPSSGGPTTPPPEGPNTPSSPNNPQSKWDGFTQVYEGNFDQQGKKLSGQGSNEELNMASVLKKSEVSDRESKKGGEKTKPESNEVHTAAEAHKTVREAYREHKKALLEAEKEWMDAVTEYERRRHESGMLGKHIFDFTHSKEQVDKALEKYNGLLDKTRAMREERTQAFLDKLQAKGGAGEPERMKGEKRIAALHEALLYSHVDQKAAFVERMRVGEGLKKESTNRFLNFAKQKGRAYAALPMHKKILYGTALSAGVGLVLGASGVVAGMGAAGGAALYGSRRLVGGTLGMGAAIGTKLGFNKFAEKRSAKEQQELKDTFSERNLSDTLQEGVSIRKKERYTKNAGSAAAVAAAVAVGVGSSHAATEIYHSDAVQNSAVGKALTDFDTKAVDAGKAFKGWYEGMKDKIGGTLDSSEQNVSPTQEVPSVHTVEPGDNVWDILQEKLKAKGVFEGMNERQRTHIIDALKDEVEALSPDKLKAMGIESGDPDLIHPGETIDLSAVLDKQSISEAVAGAPGVSPETVERAVESPAVVPESDIETHTAQPEAVPETQKPFTSQSHLDAEAQKPFTSESHLFPKGAEAGVVQQTVDTMDSPETSADTTPTDDGPRMKDFAGARNLEQIAKDFPDYHGEKSLSSFNGVWEELKTQGKIDRHLLGRYPHLKSGWGPLSHVPVRDLYDNVQGVKYNIDGTAVALSPQAEGELRSFVELTRELPGGDMLEYCVENNKSVGDYLNAVAMREGLQNPEPVATLAAVEQSQHVQNIPPEQSPQAAPVRVEETTRQSSRGAVQQSERVKVDRPRYTKPLIGVGGAYQLGEPESGFSVKVGGGARLGGGTPINYARIHLNDPIDPEVIGEYKAKYESGRFLEKNPQAATEWETKTAGELLESDPAYKKAWEAERRQIIDEAYRGRPVDLEPRDELELQNMSGEDALKQLMDEEVTLRDNKKYRVTIRRRVL